ncbi:MAG: PAS domain S-box protein [Candidatus Heimdallarchaeota archaeon]|nr:PAS domain S-box protein [Candidatus Heimdallarchaeota archaeon]
MTNNQGDNQKNYQIAADEFETLQKELEKAKLTIQSFNNQFESLFEMTNDAIILMDPKTLQFVRVNKKAIELFGLDGQKLEQYKGDDFVITNERESSFERLMEVRKGKILPIYERTFQRANGEIFIGEINLSLVYDTFNDKEYLQSIVRDISIRKNYEINKEKERKLYLKIAKAAIETIDISEFCNNVLTDLLNHLDFNLGTLRIFNEKTNALEPLAIIGVPDELKNEIRQIKINDTNTMIYEAIRKKEPIFIPDIKNSYLFEKYKHRIELFNIKSLISCPILDVNSNIIGAMQLIATKPKEIQTEDKIFFESITKMLTAALERFISSKALQKAFQEREELYSIINMSPAIVFLWRNEEGWPVDYVSDNIKRFEYTPEDFYSGRITYDKIIFSEDLSEVRNEISSYSEISNREKFIQQYRIITKSGSIKWVEDYTTIIRDTKGKIINYNGLIIDITDRVLAKSKITIERQAFKVIADAIAISKNLNELCQYILNGLIDTFRFDIGSIRLLDKESKLLVPYATKRLNNTSKTKPISIPIDSPDYITALVARTKKEIFITDIKNTDLDKKYLTRLYKENINSFVQWPILDSNNELLGVLELAAFNIKDINEEDKAVFATITDTLSNNIERVLIDEEKRNSEAKFRAFAEQSLAGVLLFNANGEIIFSNKQMQSLTDYSLQEILRMPIYRYFEKIHPENITFLDYIIDKDSKNNFQETRIDEFKLRTKTNQNKWISAYITPIDIKDSPLYAFLSIDITEEKNYQFTLLRERTILKWIAEATANSTNVSELCQKILVALIQILDLEAGSLRLYNAEDKKLHPVANYGLLEHERYLMRPISKDDDHPISKYVFSQQKFFSCDVSKDDIMGLWSTVKDFDYRTYVSWPILDANNEFIGTFHIASRAPNKLLLEDQTFFDSISEIIATAIEHIRTLEELQINEEKLYSLNEELEKRVAVRTAQLERVNKELEAFSYSVSHDLRTPLRSIDGFSHALLDDYFEKLDETGQDYLKRIRVASQRMSNLIDGLLSLSKLSRREIIKGNVNLSDVVKEIIEELKHDNLDREVKIEIQNNVLALCDPILIRTILGNLLSNAWKFTSNTKKAIIMFGSKIINNETVYFIKDNGTGFNMDYASKLFSPFQRLHSNDEYQGTGIGLTIVHRIINQHYGRIWADAEVNKGATFYFTLTKNENNIELGE